MDGTSQSMRAISSNSSGTNANAYSSTSLCLGWVSAGTPSTTPALAASYVSFDSDGFTINVTSASSAIPFAYEAYA